MRRSRSQARALAPVRLGRQLLQACVCICCVAGLLDQLALGQLGSDEGCEYEFDEYDSQGWLDTLSDEGKGPNNSSSGAVAHPLGDQAGASSSAAATAAAALLLLGGCPSGHTLQQLEQHKGLLHAAHQQQQHLQTVQEGCEEQ